MKIWVARDKDGKLFLYFTKKPVKLEDYWNNYDDWCECPYDFPSVKWEDIEPTKVKYNNKKEFVIC